MPKNMDFLTFNTDYFNNVMGITDKPVKWDELGWLIYFKPSYYIP